MPKSPIILIGAIAIAGVTVALVIGHQNHVKRRENDAVLRLQDERLSELLAEHERLSNLVAHANSTRVPDRTAELIKLRTDAEALRKQANELRKQLAENRRGRPSPTARPEANSNHNGYRDDVVSDSDSEAYKVQLYRIASASPHSFPLTNNRTTGDARNLSWAVRTYAREHQGEFPSTFDQAAPYFYKDKEPPLTSEFEIVYQGSFNELINVPKQRVALIRERQSWLTPSGKSARIYVMAEGTVKVVESDDNFQSWEAEHIIPPPSAR